jgi:hypothetical protein
MSRADVESASALRQSLQAARRVAIYYSWVARRKACGICVDATWHSAAHHQHEALP